MGKTTSMTMASVFAVMVLGAGSAGASSICGDVNDSGTVTASDALSVLKAAVGQAVELLCAPPAQPLKTGQIVPHGAGSDGALQAGATRSFTDNGDGTITDHTTGLMWEKKDDAGGIHDWENTYTWSTGTNDLDGTIATVFLATLNAGGGFAGHTDWRIPNRFELESLLNLSTVSPPAYSVFNTGCTPGCVVTACSCTRSNIQWSSTTYQVLATDAWTVLFNFGAATTFGKTLAFGGRAVRVAS